MVLAMFAFASLIWSINPHLTATRGVAIIGITLLGLYLAAVFPPKELLKCIGFAFIITCIGSLFCDLSNAVYGVHHNSLFEEVPKGYLSSQKRFWPSHGFHRSLFCYACHSERLASEMSISFSFGGDFPDYNFKVQRSMDHGFWRVDGTVIFSFRPKASNYIFLHLYYVRSFSHYVRP